MNFTEFAFRQYVSQTYCTHDFVSFRTKWFFWTFKCMGLLEISHATWLKSLSIQINSKSGTKIFNSSNLFEVNLFIFLESGIPSSNELFVLTQKEFNQSGPETFLTKQMFLIHP